MWYISSKKGFIEQWSKYQAVWSWTWEQRDHETIQVQLHPKWTLIQFKQQNETQYKGRTLM